MEWYWWALAWAWLASAVMVGWFYGEAPDESELWPEEPEVKVETIHGAHGEQLYPKREIHRR